jgi:predicted ATPase
MTLERIVFTGAPGGGKTTVLRALAQQGHIVMADSARGIIRDRKARSLSPRPAPREFADAILRQDIQHHQQAPGPGRVFFERGVVDALAMLHALGALSESELRECLHQYPYHRQVFVFPPWEAIHVEDEERDQTFAEAQRIHDGACAWYRHCGYELVEVPKVGVAQRCAHVLQVLDARAI